MVDAVRYCIYCSQEVKEIQKEIKVWGRETGVSGKFAHKSPSTEGVPGCGRQFLEEHQTFTEKDSGG